MKKIVITGASGFIGKALIAALNKQHWQIHAIVRQRLELWSPDVKQHVVADLSSTDPDKLIRVMQDAHCVVHLAAVVPGKQTETTVNATGEMAEVVAIAAANAKVDRVIVLSSVYATLAETGSDQARSYGREKLAADKIFERYLSTPPAIFIRSPVVYGEGMSGSLLSLAKLISKGIFLPLGLANERRSYISKSNLIGLICTLVEAEERRWLLTSGRKYVPTDGKAVATSDVVRAIAVGLGTNARLLPVPISIVRNLGRVFGKEELVSGALDPLEFDDNALLLSDYGWEPHEVFPESHRHWPRQALGLRPSGQATKHA